MHTHIHTHSACSLSRQLIPHFCSFFRWKSVKNCCFLLALASHEPLNRNACKVMPLLVVTFWMYHCLLFGAKLIQRKLKAFSGRYQSTWSRLNHRLFLIFHVSIPTICKRLTGLYVPYVKERGDTKNKNKNKQTPHTTRSTIFCLMKTFHVKTCL